MGLGVLIGMYVPSVAVMWVALDTAVRFTHPVVAVLVGLGAFWGAIEVMDRLTAPLNTTNQEGIHMSIEKIADEVESAVKLADALGEDAHAAVAEIVADLPVEDIDAVHAHIAKSVADDRY